MPDIIPLTLQDAPLLIAWFEWGAIIGFVVALAIGVWIQVDAGRAGRDASIWKSLAATASVVGLPAVLARVVPGVALAMRVSLGVVAMLSMAATLLALATLAGYTLIASRRLAVCPECGQPQQSDWTHCPYNAIQDAPAAVELDGPDTSIRADETPAPTAESERVAPPATLTVQPDEDADSEVPLEVRPEAVTEPPLAA